MDFGLSEQQREYRDRARAIATKKLLPEYQARERAGRIDPDLRREIGAAGLIAPEIPVEYGGRGLDRVTSGVVTEEIGRGDINVAYLQVVGSLVGQILAGNARPDVAQQWVPRISHERLPDSELRVLRGCGHWPPRECPDTFNRVVTDFLAH